MAGGIAIDGLCLPVWVVLVAIDADVNKNYSYITVLDSTDEICG